MKRLALVVALGLLATACDFRSEFISPPAGTIVDSDTATVTGSIPDTAPAGGTIVVNDVTGTWSDDGTTWSAEIPIDTDTYVTPVTAIYTAPNGDRYIQESTLVHGDKVDDGQFSPDGVGMLFTNGGLSGLGPVINSLAGGSFDISGMILAQNPLIPPTDAGAGVTITGRAYDAGAESVSVDARSTATGVQTPVRITNLYLGLDLTLSGLISGPCKLELEIPTTDIVSRFDLVPAGHGIDVNMVGDPTVTLTGVDYEFISGVCDPSTPLLGSIINSQAGAAIQGSISGGFTAQLRDPDGAGPQDSSIAEAIETALANISIAGPVGEAVKANLDAPFTAITEGNGGIDLRADADFHTTFGTGPSDCQPPAQAPDFTSSFHVDGTYPSLGAQTPSGVDYGLGLVISTSAFDQLLSSMTECGLLNQDLTEISLNGATLPVTSSVLSFLVPELATKLPPNTPMLIRVDPQTAPFLTDAASGPGGTPAEMYLADLRLSFVQPATDPSGNPVEVTWLSLSVDAPLGFEMGFDEEAGVLAPTITPPSASQVTTRVHENAAGTDEGAMEAVFSQLFPNFVDSLGASFGAFPLPGFLGLDLEVLEVARHDDDYWTLYANLNPQQQTRLENVAVTDLSTADYATDSLLFDSKEWRHRLRRRVSSTEVSVNLDGMVGADACCTVDDETATAHAGYRVAFDVVPENGDTWQLDLSHLVRGAHTAKDEGYGARSSISTVTGRVQVNGGAWQELSFQVGADGTGDANPWQGGWSGGSFNEAFTGSAARSLQGTDAASVVVEFGFDLTAFSDSNLLFPAESGNEVAVRLGANDSLTNNFTVGDYPGQGNRSIMNDGHVGTIRLTTP